MLRHDEIMVTRMLVRPHAIACQKIFALKRQHLLILISSTILKVHIVQHCHPETHEPD